MDKVKPRKPRASRKDKADLTTEAGDDGTTEVMGAQEIAASSEAVDTPETAPSEAVEPPVATTSSETTGSPLDASPQGGAVGVATESQVPADTTLHLSAGLEIKDVESAYRQLLSMLERGPAVTVDISHVAAMDTAGVQLLLAFQGEAVKRGVAVEFSGQSTAFTHALTAVGLGDAVRHVASRD